MTTHARSRTRFRLSAIMIISAMLTVVLTGQAVARTQYPDRIDLPDGFLPEGIAIEKGGTAYFGSRADGDIYAADLRTGFGAVISQGPGTPSIGLKIDRRGRLFVAGGPTGSGRVVDSDTGEIIRSYQFTASTDTFVNDVVLTKYAAVFTDSRRGELYAVPYGPRGGLSSTFYRIPLRGQWEQDTAPGAFNANGISTTPDGLALLVIQSNTGLLFRVNPLSGVATQVDTDGALLERGDGLLREGRTLYVVQNFFNKVAVLRLNRSGSRGVPTGELTSPEFDIPTTVAAYRDSLYLPNARFSSPQEPTTEFWVTRIDKP